MEAIDFIMSEQKRLMCEYAFKLGAGTAKAQCYKRKDFTMTNNKLKIELTFSKSEITHLYHTACNNFYNEQDDRFKIVYESISDVNTDRQLINDSDATLHFVDNYLNAKILQAFFKALGKPNLILIDEGGSGDFCVLAACMRGNHG
jgi:hypothetical protein